MDLTDNLGFEIPWDILPYVVKNFHNTSNFYINVTNHISHTGLSHTERENIEEKNRRYTRNIPDTSEEELKDKLYDGVINLLEPYGKHFVALFKKDMVMIAIENGVVSGGVHCILCEVDVKTETTDKKKRKRRHGFYSQFWNGHSWCLSNYNSHHLRNVHPIEKYAKKLNWKKKNLGLIQFNPIYQSMTSKTIQCGAFIR